MSPSDTASPTISIKKVRLLNLVITLGDEEKITNQILEILENLEKLNKLETGDKKINGCKIGFVSEFDFFKGFFLKSHRRFLARFDFLFPKTRFLRKCLAWCFDYKPTKPLGEINASRLLVNILTFCFKKGYNICFIGTNREQENHLRRNFKTFFHKLSDLSFISTQQLNRERRATLKFLKKSKHRLWVVAPTIKNYKGMLAKNSNSVLFSDSGAIELYSKHKNSKIKASRNQSGFFNIWLIKGMIQLIGFFIRLPILILKFWFHLVVYGFFLMMVLFKLIQK